METHLKALLISLALLALYALPAAAQDNQNCPEFESQAAAQEHLRADPTDPDQLDGNDDDGRACEGNPAPYDLEPVQEAIGSGVTQPTATPEETPEPDETPEPVPTKDVPTMPNNGGGGLATGASVPWGTMGLAASGLLAAGYAVVRRR